MLRQKLITLYDQEGKSSKAVTVSELGDLSVAELNSYLANLQIAIAIHAAHLEKCETELTQTFMYPSVEAMRNGMKCYADGSVQRKTEKFNASMAALNIPGIAAIKGPDAAEQARTKEFFQQATKTATMYLQIVKVGENLQTNHKILNSVIYAKEAVVENKMEGLKK